MADQPLAGGMANAGAVVRRGDLVRRPAPPHADAVHDVLRRLREEGFDGVPTPVALDAGGIEELTFVPGDVAVRPFPNWSLTDAALVSVGRLLRTFHDAVRRVGVDRTVTWPTDFADPEGGPILCHNDVCPENVVFVDGAARALIDFDYAAPGRPVWDLAMTARYWVPVADSDSARSSNRAHLDPFRRLRLLVDAYGLPPEQRTELVDLLGTTEDSGRRFTARRIAAGDPTYVALLAAIGGWGPWDRKRAWIEDNRSRFAEVLLAS